MWFFSQIYFPASVTIGLSGMFWKSLKDQARCISFSGMRIGCTGCLRGIAPLRSKDARTAVVMDDLRKLVDTKGAGH